MSAPSALEQVDALIAQVQQLSTRDAKQASNGSSAASRVPTSTKDNTWWPIIPPGHTAYTWYGVSDDKPSGVISAEAAAAATPAPAAAKAEAATSASAPAPAPKQEKPKGDKPAAAKAPKEAKKPAAAAAAPAKAAEATLAPDQPLFTALDIRVGQIVSASRHPKPEVTSLYVEQIDVGEAEPRTIVSGLVKYVPLDEFSKARVCVVCNLKPSALQGVTSHGMVLAASVGEGDERRVELIAPPAGAKPGDRILPLDGDYSKWAPLPLIDGKKKDKKTGEFISEWAKVAATLKTNADRVATWDGKPIGTPAGPATANSLADANIA